MMSSRPAGFARPKAIRERHPRLDAVGLAACLLCLGATTGGARAQGDPVPPSIEYGDLYPAVELAPLFADSKTFPDLLPDAAPAAVLALYDSQKSAPGFDLAAFVAAHFAGPTPPGPTVLPAASGTPLLDYVAATWSTLTQDAATVPAYSTLLPLPAPYVVPGGRFREVYYWDSYFAMLGLEGDGLRGLANGMYANFSAELDRYGHIPNGNRSYYLSRSQPPFFSLMTDLIAANGGGPATYVSHLPELLAEWRYWMAGADTLAPGTASAAAVRLPDGTVLNRYWDARDVPRDESYLEDVQTAASQTARPASVVWRNLRATAASGWDFSSRWLADGATLATDRALDIAPVDLNALLVHLETTVALAYLLKGDVPDALRFASRAFLRGAAINRLMFDPARGAYSDLLWRTGARSTALTAATVVPLFLGVATPPEARAVGDTVARRLLDLGGIETTLVQSGQQWDAPNGWAPLQWMAVRGLLNYGNGALAHTIAGRWVAKNIAGYRQTGKLVEKYDVATTGGDEGMGGEYATQIGFAWTNGVLVAMTDLYPDLRAEAGAATAP